MAIKEEKPAEESKAKAKPEEASKVKEITGLTTEQIEIYFDYSARIGSAKKVRFWGIIVTIIGFGLFGVDALPQPTSPIIGLVIGFIMFLSGRSSVKKLNRLCPSDAAIDDAWSKLADSREDEAYRVGNYKKGDAIRDSDYIFVYPTEFPTSTPKEKHYAFAQVISPNDHVIRRNYFDVLRLIYGEDQIITFRETLCLTDGWDGLDQTAEYYWNDVAGIDFNQKENTFCILAGGKEIAFPITGDKKDNEDNANADNKEALKNYIDKAEKVANALRSVIRTQKKNK